MRRLILLPLLLCFAGLAFGQAGPGYTKIAATSGLSQIDTAVTDGDVYEYQVTAQNAAGESTPLTSGPVVIPATGTHTVSLSWGASPTAGVTYNVYRIQIVVPGPPTGALVATPN